MWDKWWASITQWLTDANMWQSVMIICFKIIVIIVVAQIILRLLQRTIEKMIIEREENPLHIKPRRSKTVGKLVSNIISYAVNFIMLLMILNQMGVQVGPLLAGAGVVGLAIGFGAQSLVKDVITGFFIIFEDQFAVGDVIQTGLFKGTVEEIGLRVTKIKSASGEVHFIPNGSILNATNFSIYNTVFTIDIPLDGNCDLDRALDVIKQTLDTSAHVIPGLAQPPELLGVQSISQGEVIIRVSAESEHRFQFQATRMLNAEIKKNLDAQNITLGSGAKK
jgi:small-conductance mechanosensitive channel